MEYLKLFTDMQGVAGHENQIRRYLLKEFPEAKTDSLGNVYIKRGTSPKLMLCAHMDEVGFIVSGITDDGYLKFKSIGGVDLMCAVGKRVIIGDSSVVGVVGARAVHLQKKQDKNKPPLISEMYIDIGTQSREQAEKAVRLGDYVAFDAELSELGSNLIAAKAFDDRAGCAVLTRLLKNEYKQEFTAVFTVQEEVGLRGATVAARRVSPDCAVIIDSTVCADIDQTPAHKAVTTLGGGPAFTFMDSYMPTDRHLTEQLIGAAAAGEIPWQYKRAAVGGTDGGMVSLAATGVKTAIVALPCRYLHSAYTVIDKNDYHNCVKLLDAFLRIRGGEEV